MGFKKSNRILHRFCLILCLMHKDVRGCYKYPEGQHDPCDGVICKFSGMCIPASDGINHVCKYPDRCDNYGDSTDSIPVCGDDNTDYPNACEMRRVAFSQMKNITVKYYGKCGKYQCQRPSGLHSSVLKPTSNPHACMYVMFPDDDYRTF